jgi:hypothetical protein
VLLEVAQAQRHRLNGAALLLLVRAGVEFRGGVQVERDDLPGVEQDEGVAA